MLWPAENIKTRREFIKQSAMAAGMLTLLNACGPGVKTLKSPLDSNSLSKFRKGFSGRVILPGDAEYETARKVIFITRETDKHPAIVAQCKNEEDVLRCIDLAHQHELEVAVRSGNHSVMGWGTCEKGIVIDLSKMKGITVDPIRKTAQVTAGNTAEEILAAAAQYGLAPVLGECGSVGAGLTLGGGLGWLSGKYGAACDNLISARIITADAHTIKTDLGTNQDLFWAIRGGGGNCGVATTFEYQLRPVREVLGGGLVYPISKAGDMLRFFKDFMSTAPDELQPECFLTTNGRGSIRIEFVYFGNLNEGEQLLNTFRKFKTPDQDWIKRRTYAEIYKMDPVDDTMHCPSVTFKTSYVEQLSDEVIDIILDRLAQPPAACGLGFLFGHYMHGEVCRVKPDTTAFELRKSGAVHLGFWSEWKESQNESACISWLDKTVDVLQPYSGGRIYSNYMSTTGENTAKAVYGSNYTRLAELKKKYDPQNFFHLNQNILAPKP